MGRANEGRTVRDGWPRYAKQATRVPITTIPAWIGVGQTDFKKGTGCDNRGTTNEACKSNQRVETQA
jgi:hypothetical protein